MPFEVSAREVDRIIVVDAVGRLTLMESRTRLRDLIHVFASSGHKFFLLNLSGVDFIDSDGMGELVRSHAIIRQQGGELKLVNLHERVKHLLDLTRLNTLFAIYMEERAALQDFRRQA